jgi:hypothetical protein
MDISVSGYLVEDDEEVAGCKLTQITDFSSLGGQSCPLSFESYILDTDAPPSPQPGSRNA